MNLQVRSENGTGKLLFEWDPEKDTITIVHKGTCFCVKLIKLSQRGTYDILDKRPKPQV